MTRTQALRLMVAKYGKTAAVEDKGARYAWDEESRQRSSAALREHQKQKPVAPNILDPAEWPDDATVGAFRAARLAYVQKRQAWDKREGQLLSESYRHRYSVGTTNALFFHVLGRGDTWEAALTAAGIKLVNKVSA